MVTQELCDDVEIEIDTYTQVYRYIDTNTHLLTHSQSTGEPIVEFSQSCQDKLMENYRHQLH